MIDGFDAVPQKLSWQPDWATMWRAEPCDCAPVAYAVCRAARSDAAAFARLMQGIIAYYEPKLYHLHAAELNDRNRLRCVFSLYRNPEIFNIDTNNSPCLVHNVKIRLDRYGPV